MISIFSNQSKMTGNRDSNLELYRIICMIMIVAHHYVVNSGLLSETGPVPSNPTSANSLFLCIFGMWGKTGINCFLMITGYFMCKSSITLRKFFKLLLWIYIYKLIIYFLFLNLGYETLSLIRILKLLMPIWGVNQNFTSCFLVFWLTIPFWNIFIQSISKRQHQLLLILLVGVYSVLGSIPTFGVSVNYVTWFGVLYLVSSYLRIYPSPIFEKKKLWMSITILASMVAVLSVVLMQLRFNNYIYFFVSDSNKFLALVISVASFLWFKNLNVSYSKLINTIGASTFGVFLIHANSNAMRQWLWSDTVNCVGHYNLPLYQLIGFSFGVVLIIFTTCIVIDRIRIKLIEEPFFKWFDKHQKKMQYDQ